MTIGARISEEGVEFFGIEEVNAALKSGRKIARFEEGQVMVEEVLPEESGEEEPAYAIAGFEIAITFEGDK